MLHHVRHRAEIATPAALAKVLLGRSKSRTRQALTSLLFLILPINKLANSVAQ